MQTFKQLFSDLNSKGIIHGEHFDFADDGGDHSAYFIIGMVVLSVLQMVSVHDSGLPVVTLRLPVVEVDLFHKLLLMVLEFSHIVEL